MLPPPLEAIWQEMEARRAEILRETEGLSEAQAAWRPAPDEWSIALILHHLTLAEVATGKLTSKLLKEGGDSPAGFPADLAAFRPVPEWPAGPREAPPLVKPSEGLDLQGLLAGIRAARERSRQSLERMAAVDPRTLTFPHFRLGELDLGQWWMLQARHDGDHAQQLRRIKASPGFPAR